MLESASVTSLQALVDFKGAIAGFQDEARKALCAAEMDVRRAVDWLDDQKKHWQQQVRVWEDNVSEAKLNLERKKLYKIFDKPPDTTEEEQILRYARRRLDEAQEKVEHCRRWGPILQRAVEEYEAPVRGLSNLVEGDLNRAAALLDRLLASLDAYLALTPEAGKGAS